MLDKKDQKDKPIKEEKYISTGPYILDSLIDKDNKRKDYKGIPRSLSIEVYEEERYIILYAAQQVIQNNDFVIYLDFDNTLEKHLENKKDIHLDIKSPNFLYLIPSSFQEGVQAVGNFLIRVRPTLIVIDSVVSIIPKETLKDTSAGLKARQLASFLLWADKQIKKYNCALILINPYRSNS